MIIREAYPYQRLRAPVLVPAHAGSPPSAAGRTACQWATARKILADEKLVTAFLAYNGHGGRLVTGTDTKRILLVSMLVKPLDEVRAAPRPSLHLLFRSPPTTRVLCVLRSTSGRRIDPTSP